MNSSSSITLLHTAQQNLQKNDSGIKDKVEQSREWKSTLLYTSKL